LEGASCGKSEVSGIKSFQKKNRDKFFATWRKSLSNHFDSSGDFTTHYRAANRLNGKKTILVIDSSLPYYDKESGGHRIYSILKILRSQNYNLIFLPTNEIADEPYASELSSMGVELLVDESRENGFKKFLYERLDIIDFAWICRPQMFDQFGKFLEKKSNAKIIYDTIDLHHLRLKRKWILNGGNDRKLEKKWKQFYKKEKKFSKQSDITLTVTQDEAKVVERWDVKRVFVLPNIHVPRGGQIPPFSGRGGLLFIGSYLHPPNVDAVKFLVNEILPIVWRKFPQMQVTLLGSNPNNDVLDLSTDRVKVTGFIEDVVPYFDLAQIFVSPLRYGAGMKGKIGQSMSLGLPVVTTTIGAEGMFLENEKNALISDNPLEISENILRLGSDEELWTRLSMEGVKLMNRFSPKVISLQLEKMFVSK
jgi:glycosyltransferase involved in cell wall biosynthesis